MKAITNARQIGATVRDKRLALGMTQQQLADKANVSRGFISRIEKGAAAAVYPQKMLDVLAVLGLVMMIDGIEKAPRQQLKEAAAGQDSQLGISSDWNVGALSSSNQGCAPAELRRESTATSRVPKPRSTEIVPLQISPDLLKPRPTNTSTTKKVGSDR